MHYLRPPNSADGKDSSGVIMHLTAAPVPRAAVRGARRLLRAVRRCIKCESSSELTLIYLVVLRAF